MKHTLTMLGLLLMSNLFAQTEFAPIGATWHYGTLDRSFSGISHVGYLIYKSVKDTTINGQTCRKIISTTDENDSIGIETHILRIEGDSIYQLSRDGNFNLLYNFAAQTGESWLTKTVEGIPYIVHVDSIITKTYNGVVHEVQIVRLDDFVFNYRENFIKGIGSAQFLFPIHLNIACGTEMDLRCYNEVDSSFIIGNTLIDCQEVYKISVQNKIPKSAYQIQPNPSKGIINLVLDKMFKDTHVAIYNLSGQLISEKLIEQKSTNISLSEKGMYLMKIQIGDKYRTEKIFINN